MRLALLSYAFYGVAIAQRREAEVLSIDRKYTTTEQLCSTRLVSTFVLDIETTTKTKHVNSTAYKEHCDSTSKYTLVANTTVVLTGTGTTTEETTVSGITRVITPTVTVTTTTTVSQWTTSTKFYTKNVATTITATIPAPARRTPLASSSMYMAIKQPGQERSKNTEDLHTLNIRNPRMSLDLYPSRVECVDVIKTFITSTIKPFWCDGRHNTTVFGTSTIRKAVYVTKTATETFALDGAVTTLSNTASTVYEEATWMMSILQLLQIPVTQTSIAPTATVYEACSDKNIIGTVNGGYGIAQIQFPTNFTAFSLVVARDNPAQHCCVACQEAPYCIWSFVGHYNDCTLIIGAVDCDATQSYRSLFKSSLDLPPNTGFTISNGQCGMIENGGRLYKDDDTS